MKKFKHKQTGEIAIFDCPPNYYTIKVGGYVHKKIIENSNDWEEIKEEKQEETPWLITTISRADDSESFYLNKSGCYSFDKEKTNGGYTLYELMNTGRSIKSGAFKIKSVKNSNGNEFTIGDKLQVEDETLTIKEFVIFRDKYMYVLFNETDEHENINDLEKLESADKSKPLFTTEDGVELFEEKQLFSVCIKANWEERRYSIKQAKQITEAWLHFNTKEAREEYIKQHKPIYSIFDIKNMLENISFDDSRIIEIIIDDLLKLKK